ncbi:MAG: DNA mismatch repair endonuclease MutL, partial [Clostridia bacterium]|nr:DNA mismatch repair endonuclease MutL [Clostridia bacterium]
MIRQLDPSVYNKISAGEVVERPASVVKELVENSIDAGAKRIAIEITGGGLEQIVVSDDGKGIEREDLAKVFLPHATSKIATSDDLFGIATMGFRGEAMASIAAVAMVNLTSRVEGADAFSIQVDGGVVGPIEGASASFGTTVTVRNLFFHTPARLKFLKSTKSETRDITALVEKVMIANPTIAIRYVVDGKTVYETAGDGLEEVIHALYDDDTVSHLIPVKGEEYGYSVEGYVSDTLYSRGTRTAQTTVVNGRVISNQQLTGALNNAYRDYLMKHCYPVLVLSIKVPYDEVDVNVHPTKADVRFVYANKLFGFVYRTVKAALDEDLSKGALFFDVVQESNPIHSVEPAHWDLGVEDRPQAKVDLSYLDLLTTRPQVAEENDLLNELKREQAAKAPEKPGNLTKSSAQPVFETQSMDDLLGLTEDKPTQEAFAPIKVLGQILGTYLIAEYKGEMLVIDQHAAAERVLFDRLVEEYANGSVVEQPLLLPY